MSAVRVPSLPPARRLACALLALCWILLHVAAVVHVHPHLHPHSHPHVTAGVHAHAGCPHDVPAAAHDGAAAHTLPDPDEADADDAACGLCQAMVRTLEALTRDLAALLYLHEPPAPAFASVHAVPEAPARLLPPGRAPPAA